MPLPEVRKIFEVKPVILGGGPTDAAKRTALSRADHIEAVTYWNKVVAGLRSKRAAS
jgi:hypothetical protein